MGLAFHALLISGAHESIFAFTTGATAAVAATGQAVTVWLTDNALAGFACVEGITLAAGAATLVIAADKAITLGLALYALVLFTEGPRSAAPAHATTAIGATLFAVAVWGAALVGEGVKAARADVFAAVAELEAVGVAVAFAARAAPLWGV